MLRPCTSFARYGDKSTDLGARDLGPHSDSTFSSTFCLGQVFYLLGLSLKKKEKKRKRNMDHLQNGVLRMKWENGYGIPISLPKLYFIIYCEPNILQTFVI